MNQTVTQALGIHRKPQIGVRQDEPVPTSQHPTCLTPPPAHPGVMPRRSGRALHTDRNKALAAGWEPKTTEELATAITTCPSCNEAAPLDATSCRDHLLTFLAGVARDHTYPQPQGTWTDRECGVVASILARQQWLLHEGARALPGGCGHYHRPGRELFLAGNATRPDACQNLLIEYCRQGHDGADTVELYPPVPTFQEAIEIFVEWILPLAQTNAALAQGALQDLLLYLSDHDLPGQLATSLRDNLGKNNLGSKVNRAMEASMTSAETTRQLLHDSHDPELRLAVGQDLSAKLRAKAERSLNDPVLAEAYQELAHRAATAVEPPSNRSIRAFLAQVIDEEMAFHELDGRQWNPDTAALAQALADDLELLRKAGSPTLQQYAGTLLHNLRTQGLVSADQANPEHLRAAAIGLVEESCVRAFRASHTDDQDQR